MHASSGGPEARAQRPNEGTNVKPTPPSSDVVALREEPGPIRHRVPSCPFRPLLTARLVLQGQKVNEESSAVIHLAGGLISEETPPFTDAEGLDEKYFNEDLHLS